MFRFIIVDNDSRIRDEIASIIDWEKIGFKLIGSFDNTNRALQAMERQNIDLIISNLCTKDADILCFVGFIKNKYPSTKIIIYSNMVSSKCLLEAFRLKIDDFLKYPLDISRLNQCAHQLEKELSIVNETKNTIKLLKTRINVLEGLEDKLESNKTPPADYISYEYFRTNVSKYNILLPGNVFCVAVLKASEQKKPVTAVKSPLYYSIYNLTDNFLRLVENCLVVQSICEYTVVIMSDNSGDNLNKKFSSYLKAIKNKVNLELGLELCIGVGRNVYSLNGIPGSWKDAVSAVDYKYALGYNNIIYYEEIMNKSNKEIGCSIANLEDKIITAICHSNFSDAVCNVNLFFENMRSNLHSYENYFYCVQRIVLSIRKALCKNSSIPCREIEEQFSMLSNCNFNYIDHDEELLITTLKKLMYSPTYKKEYSSDTICKKAITYIEDNYNNPELSLNMICKHLALSVSYFSSIFKSYSGTTFVDYLTNIRMEKAKELLITTDSKSYQIAEKIGYNDPHYFSILFKKKTGLPPTKYKQTVVQCRQ